MYFVLFTTKSTTTPVLDANVAPFDGAISIAGGCGSSELLSGFVSGFTAGVTSGSTSSGKTSFK